jgi:membrane protease YdiL (CAAX protease family)
MLRKRIVTFLWSGAVAFLIVLVGQGVWGVLVTANLRAATSLPWAVPVMAVVLFVMWTYLGGRWWPSRTSETRRRCLRANPVARNVLLWSFAAGSAGVVAVAAYWICLSQLVAFPANQLPDTSKYPALTVVPMLIMACIAAPVAEEAAFRGYCWTILERHFRPTSVFVLSSLLFALAHFTQGLALAKLLVYFLGGLLFAGVAYAANSVWASIPVHALADLVAFTLLWPRDSTRQTVFDGGLNVWFWIHATQALIFTVIAALLLQKTRRVARAKNSIAPSASF